MKKHILARMVAASYSAGVTALVCLALPLNASASDVDIYQQAREGKVTLMFMLDTSGSMDTKDPSGGGLTRIAQLRNGMSMLLAGGNGVERLGDDVIIGLSVFEGNNGRVVVPARALGETIPGNVVTPHIKPLWYRTGSSGNRKYSTCLDAAPLDTCSNWSTPVSQNPVTGSPLTQNCSFPNTTSCLLYYVDASTSRAKLQRDELIAQSAALTTGGVTPTAYAYAEAAAALMGTTTGFTAPGIIGRVNTSNTARFYKCTVPTATGGCTTYDTAYTTIPAFDYRTGPSNNYYTYYRNNIAASAYSGFPRAPSDALEADGSKYKKPDSIKEQIDNPDNEPKCSGQGIYFLTDGQPNHLGVNTGADGKSGTAYELMSKSLDTKAGSFDCTASPLGKLPDSSYYAVTGSGASNRSSHWKCIGKYAETLLDPGKNPLGLKVRTAVVGFGADLDSPTDPDVKEAKTWGDLGGGGFYKGAVATDVVNSVKDFLGKLKVEIPSVTTGSPTIPVDSLNSTNIQDAAFYPQFQPTPNKPYRLWVGNVKKYRVLNSSLVDKNGTSIAKPTVDPVTGNQFNLGELRNDVDDFWVNKDEGTLDANGVSIDPNPSKRNLSYFETDDKGTDSPSDDVPVKRYYGGALSQLQLKYYAANSPTERKLITDRKGGEVATNTLRQVGRADFLGANSFGNDSKRGYILGLLGYDIASDLAAQVAADKTNQTLITATKLDDATQTGYLRQLGSVMHSTPLLLTQEAQTKLDTQGNLGYINRDDLILFGTTQGVLHVVNAESGKELFAFVPNEMIEKQYSAFLEKTKQDGSLLYGIDGAWSAYTEYKTTSATSTNTPFISVRGKEGSSDNPFSGRGKQWVYGGLRMGGRSYYALDLTLVRTASSTNPALLFRIDPDNQQVVRPATTPAGVAQSSNPTFSALQYMGQSWSKPSIARVNWKGQRKLVMFVGGGYDADGVGNCVDASNNALAIGYECENYNQTNGKGAGVYMFDATTGDLLWWASSKVSANQNGTATQQAKQVVDMKYSVPSRIKTVDRDADGLTDHLYFGDLGGQVWRVDLNNQIVASDTSTPFAKRAVKLLQSEGTAGKYARFYEAPTVTIHDGLDGSGTFAAVSIASGNRSSPKANYATSDGYANDRSFVIFDKDVTRTDLYSIVENPTDSTALLTKNLTSSGLQKMDAARSTVFDDNTKKTMKGWYYNFDQQLNTASGYQFKTILRPQTIKAMGEPVAIGNDLYVSVFDSSKPGLAGDCGAGVIGESFIHRFCLPYGVCADAGIKHTFSTGAGIIGVTIGQGKDPQSRALVFNSQEQKNQLRDGPVALYNYSGLVKLVSQRWYERYADATKIGS